MFSPNGQTLANVSGTIDWTIRLWNVNTGRHRQILTNQGFTSFIYGAAFSPDGKTLASAERLRETRSPGSGIVRLWNVATGEHNRTFRLQQAVLCVSFHPNGQMLACGDLGNSIHILDVTTRKQIKVLIGHTDIVNNISFSPDGKTLASKSYDGTILLWDLTSTVHTDNTTK